ncbi:MAG: hypothetical protein IKC28_02090 [Clostridia bacterium]|nr:hypothetical protein [Clostridia bacterium]
MNRRLSILSALLATALLLYSMPGLLTRYFSSTGRTDERLKPARGRTMVVWVTSWMEEDRKLIASLCTAFEKQRPGLRIYLRRADAQELSAPDAVLPDVVLHVTGDISSPTDGLMPMALPEEMQSGRAASGCCQGRQYGIPLWYSPMVFSVPKAWFIPEGQQEQMNEPGQAYFSQKPVQPEGTTATVSFADLPWNRMLEAGQVVSENGVGLCLLTLECPLPLRQEWRKLSPILRKPEDGEAAVCSLRTHQARGQEVLALSLPYAGQQARYVSLCREGEDAAAFLRFLLGGEAQQAAREALLAPMMGDTETAEEVFLPNAFLMDQTNVNQHCLQGVAAGEDPVATLLKLR